MANITQAVWDILSNDISIRKNIMRGLINNRALAKYLIDTHHINASLDAVISAIRRFETDTSFKEELTNIKEALHGSLISTKTNIVRIELKQGNRNGQHLEKLLCNHVLFQEDDLRVSKGHEHLKVIISQNDLQKVLEIIPKDAIVSIEENLAELNITLYKQEALQTKGLFARITNEIANNNINIVEVITCLPELLIFFNQNDLVKAHEAVLALVQNGKEL